MVIVNGMGRISSHAEDLLITYSYIMSGQFKE